MIELELAQRQMAEEKAKLARLDVVKLLSAPEELPALPPVAVRVMEITANPKATLFELKSVVETDEALAAKILKFANSPLYARVGRITELSAALVTLGFLTIRSLVVTTCAHTLFRKGGSYTSDDLLLWEHSVRCAIAARAMADRLGYKRQEEAFVAGLLHDIGKLVILDAVPGYLSRFCEWSVALGREFWEVEMEVIGLDHTKVAEHIFSKWRFPLELSEPVCRHHMPDLASENRPLAYIVSTANSLFPVENCVVAVLSDEQIAQLPFARQNSLSPQQIAELRETADGLYRESAELFRL